MIITNKILNRFHAKIDKTGKCWEWTAGKTHNGYGRFNVNGKTIRAHRLIYELEVGPVGNLFVLHHCDNPGCVNPKHLFLGTQADNVADRKRKQRPSGMPGVKNHKAKLNEIDIRAIRLLSGKATQQAIAKQFGISQMQVSRILNRQHWSHI